MSLKKILFEKEELLLESAVISDVFLENFFCSFSSFFIFSLFNEEKNFSIKIDSFILKFL